MCARSNHILTFRLMILACASLTLVIFLVHDLKDRMTLMVVIVSLFVKATVFSHEDIRHIVQIQKLRIQKKLQDNSEAIMRTLT